MISVPQAVALLRDIQRRHTPVYVQYVVAGMTSCVYGFVTGASMEALSIGSPRARSSVELGLEGAGFEYFEGAAAKSLVSGAEPLGCSAALVVRSAAGLVTLLIADHAASSPVLSGWKEIAAYCGRGVRTVQRWERELQMPVRRPRDLHGPVLALEEELRGWLASRAVLEDTRGALVLMKPNSTAPAGAAGPRKDDDADRAVAS